MAISLSNIKKSSGSSRPGKRIGRGNSSGKGTYSGRGLKGQKSRSGVSRFKLKRLGMKKNLLKIPKSRGFNALSPKNQVVNVLKINENFKDNEVVNAQVLWEKGLISRKNLPVKILGKEKLIPRGLKFEKISFSKSVIEQLDKK
ncbi:MAG: 50S ribosomal protein L15 [Patescibacteria group bacterium]|nr:50S ribosomal protein L15 [Patescibacteria group bacterium]